MNAATTEFMDQGENLSQLISAITSACNAYECDSLSDSGSSAKRLSRSLDALHSELVSDPTQAVIFTESNLLACDCLSAAVSTLERCSQDVAARIVKLFSIVVGSSSALDLLFKFRLVEALIPLIQEPQLKVKAMEMLATITYGRRFSGHEAFIDTLLPILVQNIVSSDVSLCPSLALLCNLASRCTPVHVSVRALDGDATLRRAVNKLLLHKDNRVVILAVAVMCSTMNQEFRKLVTVERNLDQTFKLSFSLILSAQRSSAFCYAADVLVRLLTDKHAQHFLLNNSEKVDSFMAKTTDLLTTTDGDHLTKVLEVLCSFSEISALRSSLTRLMFAPVPQEDGSTQEVLIGLMFISSLTGTSSKLSMSLAALRLLTVIYETLLLDQTQADSACYLNFAFLSECLKQPHIDSKDSRMAELSSNKLLATVQLLSLLASSTNERLAGLDSNSELLTSLLTEVEQTTLTDIIATELRDNPVCTHWSRHHTPDLQHSNCSETGVKIVISLLTTLHEFGRTSQDYNQIFQQYLQKNCLLPFVAYGLSCNSTDLVQGTLALLKQSLSALPLSVLGDILTGMNKNKAARHSDTTSQNNTRRNLPSVDGQYTTSQGLDYDKLRGTPDSKTLKSRNKENLREIIPGSQSSPNDGVKPEADSLSEQLGNLKMSGDSHISDIISIYESKLRAQKTKESHLDDLFQAKTMALSQADRLLAQYKNRLAQSDHESGKLRSIVAESERRSEDYRSKMNEMQIDRERMVVEVERLLEDSRRLEDTQRALSSVKKELSSLTELHSTLSKHADNLKQQHRELEGEYTTLKEADRKKAAQITDLTKKRKKQDDELGSLKSQINGLEKSLKQKEDKLRLIFEAAK